MAQPGTYNDGRAYYLAKGRYAPTESLEVRTSTIHPIVRGFPTSEAFLAAVQREMKIRCYQPASIK